MRQTSKIWKVDAMNIKWSFPRAKQPWMSWLASKLSCKSVDWVKHDQPRKRHLFEELKINKSLSLTSDVILIDKMSLFHLLTWLLEWRNDTIFKSISWWIENKSFWGKKRLLSFSSKFYYNKDNLQARKVSIERLTWWWPADCRSQSQWTFFQRNTGALCNSWLSNSMILKNICILNRCDSIHSRVI